MEEERKGNGRGIDREWKRKGKGMEEEWKGNLAKGLKEKSRNKKGTKTKERE